MRFAYYCVLCHAKGTIYVEEISDKTTVCLGYDTQASYQSTQDH